MTQTLPLVGHEPHDRIVHRVDTLPEAADRLLLETGGDVRGDVDVICAFLVETLLPHLDATETTLYPELERLYQNRHSMSPMRREHAEVRRLVAEFARLTEQVDAGHLSLGRTMAIRRILFQLYALLKIHLAEEEVYLQIAERGGTAEVADLLAAAVEHPGFGAR